MPRASRTQLLLTLTALTLGALPSTARAAGPPTPQVLDADDPSIETNLTSPPGNELLRLGPTDDDLVIAAQKVRTTIQEAPSIITVITRRQIQERGYRTLNDVLRTVPGFEGDRWDGNGWQKEAFARGNPQTILILLNGVNIVEPVRNGLTLDRKIPLEIVERVEVTSGPGGVLWGSNALLGVINIVTKRPDDTGLIATIGAGDGPGERLALKGGLGVSHRFSPQVGVFAYLDFFSTTGPDLRIDAQKIVGSLPAPAPDGWTFYLPEPTTVTTGKRAWWLNFSGRIELGPVALDWLLPFETDYRALATGGADLTHDYLTNTTSSRGVTRSRDSVRAAILSYQDRFAQDALGLAARAYLVSWQIDEDPFGVYPASPLVYAAQGHTRDIRLALTSNDLIRTGGALDIDWRLHRSLTLLAGAEAFTDISDGLTQTSWAADTLGTCPTGFTFTPYDAQLPCRITEPQVTPSDTVTGGGFVNLDWKATRWLALSGGARIQFSNQYRPTPLYSGGFVFKLADATYLKLFGSMGLRPPSLVASHVNGNPTSGVSFNPGTDLDAESSQSAELEFNTTFLRDVGPIRDLFLRTNGAYSVLDGIIERVQGTYDNSGIRRVGTAEAALRLRFDAGHELWANYSYTRVFDDRAFSGELTNISQHIANFGARLSFLDDHIELDTVFTFKSSPQDANRPAVYDPNHPGYSVSCDILLASAATSTDPGVQARAAACRMPTLAGGVWVAPHWDVMQRLPATYYLDVGVRFKNLWRDLTLAFYGRNLLNFQTYDADFYSDARVISLPQPKPGMSFFGQLSFGL